MYVFYESCISRPGDLYAFSIYTVTPFLSQHSVTSCRAVENVLACFTEIALYHTFGKPVFSCIYELTEKKTQNVHVCPVLYRSEFSLGS